MNDVWYLDQVIPWKIDSEDGMAPNSSMLRLENCVITKQDSINGVLLHIHSIDSGGVIDANKVFDV